MSINKEIINDLRRSQQRIAELEAELEAQKNERVEWQQKFWLEEAKVERLEAEKAEQYQRAQFYRVALQEIRDNTPAGQPNCWPHHHWYLAKASKAINHAELEGKQE